VSGWPKGELPGRPTKNGGRAGSREKEIKLPNGLKVEGGFEREKEKNRRAEGG